MVESADLIMQNNRASTKLLMIHMDKLGSGIGAVYTEVNAANKFLNGPMIAHMENSRRYYEESLKSMQNTNAMLHELLQMQINLYSKTSNN